MKHTKFLFTGREAFTLVEVLIVITISAMLSAIVIGYSSISRNEVSVSIEAAKISQSIFQAKTISIATYANSVSSCGYGVSFDYSAGTYSIFAYNPSGVSSCPDSTKVAITGISSDEMVKYSDATWKIPVARGVLLKKQSDSMTLVLFYPPDPTTFISRDSGGTSFTFTNSNQSNIYLSPAGNASATKIISVNSAGQIAL